MKQSKCLSLRSGLPPVNTRHQSQTEWKISLRYDKLSLGVSKIEKGDRMTEIITKSKVCMVGNCNISVTANFGNGWDTHIKFFA